MQLQLIAVRYSVYVIKLFEQRALRFMTSAHAIQQGL